ncbi:hypothetical protein ACFQZZ_20420 [Nocardia sp. GCM10030253]|uniref:hypothetical protein n=1 Tax=Nocardia sp. GCM10030253 TaxID=3273404 RepID=UPI003641E633
MYPAGGAVLPARNLNGLWTHFRNFFAANTARVVTARQSGGGWEGWLQVELWTYVQAQDPGFGLVREQFYPDNVTRADFGLGNLRVELKAQTLNESVAAFVTRVDADVEKMERIVEGSLGYVVAVYWGQNQFNNQTDVVEVQYAPFRVCRMFVEDVNDDSMSDST